MYKKNPDTLKKMCRSQIPPLPKNRGRYLQKQITQTRNLKDINELDTQEIEPPLEKENEIETIGPEPTMYITELI